MKSIMLTIAATSLVLLIQAQVDRVQFIDSLASKFKSCKTVLLFSELRDTADDQSGKKYSQRNSYYYDFVHKELRYIEVYEFEDLLKSRRIEKTFRKKRDIPSSTHIIFSFFENKLVKVKLIPPKVQCEKCFEEYYYVNDMIILQNDKSAFGMRRNLLNESSFYLSRLQTLINANMVESM